MDVYPSIEELLPKVLLAKIPAALADEIAVRYTTLGDKYLTDKFHTDGRRINGMMDTDRVTNCNEEVVDAVFCIIGQIFKNKQAKNTETDLELSFVLDALISIYSALAGMFNRGEYA
jgi:hypothetical protein